MIRLEDYIKTLQKKFEECGNIEVAICEEGNYSTGQFAELYDTPVVEEFKFGLSWVSPDGTLTHGSEVRKVLVIGMSSQWC